MVSHSTGTLYASQYWLWSPTARVCAGSFTVRVCTGYGLPQHVCVLAVFTVRGCTGYGFL